MSASHPAYVQRNLETTNDKGATGDPSRSDGFTKVQPRKRDRGKAGSGNSSEVLKSGPQTLQVQITNVNPSLGEDQIKDYLKAKDDKVNVLDVTDESSAGWSTKRFVVTFDIAHLEKVLSDEFWPEDIYYKRWYPARRKPPGDFKLTAAK